MVTAVKVISPTRATVTYDILIDGKPATGGAQHCTCPPGRRWPPGYSPSSPSAHVQPPPRPWPSRSLWPSGADVAARATEVGLRAGPAMRILGMAAEGQCAMVA